MFSNYTIIISKTENLQKQLNFLVEDFIEKELKII
jgi:hypothetical protein